MRLVSVLGVAAAVLVLAALVMVVELGRFFGRKPEARGRRIPATRATAPRFVSFRFVGFDAGRPLVRDTSFWGFRTNVPIQWLPRTHWAIWSMRQEGSTPVVIHQVVFVPSTLPETHDRNWYHRNGMNLASALAR